MVWRIGVGSGDVGQGTVWSGRSGVGPVRSGWFGEIGRVWCGAVGRGALGFGLAGVALAWPGWVGSGWV